MALQAGLTCFGNITLLAAALRLADRYKTRPLSRNASAPAGWQSDVEFLGLTLFGSFASAAMIKYGSLFADPLFEPSLPLALTLIGAGTTATGVLLHRRSRVEPDTRETQ